MGSVAADDAEFQDTPLLTSMFEATSRGDNDGIDRILDSSDDAVKARAPTAGVWRGGPGSSRTPTSWPPSRRTGATHCQNLRTCRAKSRRPCARAIATKTP